MAGVLLARAPVKTEILNDLNGRVVNWWRAVRDKPEEFGRLLEFTPFSRAEYEWGVVGDGRRILAALTPGVGVPCGG